MGPTGQTSLALNSDRNFPRDTFVKIMQLLDLCILSTESLRFPPGLLTAAALYHFSCQKVALDVSGYSRDELNSCVRWMTPLAKALAHDGLKPMKKISGKYESECHNFQPWDKPLETLKRAHQRYLLQKIGNGSGSRGTAASGSMRTTNVND